VFFPDDGKQNEGWQLVHSPVPFKAFQGAVEVTWCFWCPPVSLDTLQHLSKVLWISRTSCFVDQKGFGFFFPWWRWIDHFRNDNTLQQRTTLICWFLCSIHFK